MNRFVRTGIRCVLCLLALLLLCVTPAGALAERETAEGDGAFLSCTYTLPEKYAGMEAHLSDGDVSTRVSMTKDDTVGLTLPAEAAWLYLVWYSVPKAPLVSFFDASGDPVGTFAPDGALLHRLIEIPAGSRSATLTAGAGFSVCELRACQTPPEDLLLPDGPPAKADVLLVVAHTGDESYYFGGLLPILCGEKGYTAAVLFLSSESRLAEEQAMLALRAYGVVEQPLFAGLTYRLRPYGKNSAQVLWGKDMRTADVIAHVIRACQPEIVITHDPSGEDGDAMHAYAALMTERAVARAADADALPVASGAPETWKAARLYEHASGGGVALPIDAQLPAMDGSTARELAQRGFDRYDYLRLYHKTSLAASAPYYVLAEEYRSPDKDPLTDLSIDPMPTPSPTQEPTPTPTPAPEPTAAPTATPVSEDGALSAFCAAVKRHRAAIVSVAGLVTAVLVLVAVLRRNEHKRLVLWLILSLLPLLLGLLLALGLPAVDAAETARREAAATPVPTETPAPTATPSPAPTEEPAPTPGPDDAWSRQEGEEETVVFDNDAGFYSYHSDTLSVEVQRHDIRNANDQPVRYFVAHIRMRGADAFRPGFGNYRENGNDPVDPFVMARRYKAVLAISGDNMINFDIKNKDIIIRNGNFYLDNRNGSTMVFSPDGMSMYTVPAKTTTAAALLDQGVRNTFSFGPILISDGAINEKASTHYLAGYNPRVGVGYIDEGHFVAIVVEGRVGKYSRGMRMEEFAALFHDLGCVEAYNLDGGASSSMLFMGEYINRRMPNQYRNVPDLLMWGYSDLVPDQNAAQVNDPFYRG